jgi:undecaprenyl-diphosphatase
MHVATAIALLIYFWREWARIIAGFFTSLRQFARPAPGTKRWQLRSTDQKLAWMIVLATIPVGLVGLEYEHEFRVITGHAITAAYFLIANGLILYAAERFRRPASVRADHEQAAEDEQADRARPVPAREPAMLAAQGDNQAARGRAPRHAYGGGSSQRQGQRAMRREQIAAAARSDRRLAGMGYLRTVLVGSTQILALLAGISRDGVVMAGGMFSGLSRQDAARFSFLLATPVIFAAGALKVGDLMGPLGNGIRGQVLVGSLLSGVGAYLSVRYLVKYFRTRTLTPFAIYCVVVGAGSIVYLSVR